MNADWARMVIDDLGLTIWRNEYYPPSDGNNGTDADRSKHSPVIAGLRDHAAASRVPLKTGPHRLVGTGQHEVRVRS